MVHAAFDVFHILRDCPKKIESASLWGSMLLLGCNDGSLIMSVPNEEIQLPEGSKNESRMYKIKDVKNGLNRRSIIQMDVLQSRSLLLTLSDGVSVYSLPELKLVLHLQKTRGANLYSWEETRGILCVAKQKKLQFFRFDVQNVFVESKELNCPDNVKAMEFFGEFLGLALTNRKEYVLMNQHTANVTDVFSSGKTQNPVIIPFSEKEVLFGKDNICIFVDCHGKATRSGGELRWSEAPASVILDPPYALGRLSRFIEVRSLRAGHALIQSLPLQKAKVLVRTHAGIFAASDSSVYRIMPVDLSVQIIQLSFNNNYEEALSLCTLLPSNQSELRIHSQNSIHQRYGYHLFNEKKFEEALYHFSLSSIDLHSILSLYPDIKIPKSISSSFIALSSPPPPPPPPSSFSSSPPTELDAESMSLKAQDDYTSNANANAQPLCGGELVQALLALVGYLYEKRSQLLYLLEQEKSKKEMELVSKEVDYIISRNKSKLTNSESQDIVKSKPNQSQSQMSVLRSYADVSSGLTTIQEEKVVVGNEKDDVKGEKDRDKDKEVVMDDHLIMITVLDTSLVQALLLIDQNSVKLSQKHALAHVAQSRMSSSFTDRLSQKQNLQSSSFPHQQSNHVRSNSAVTAMSSDTSQYDTSSLLTLLSNTNYCDIETIEDKMMSGGRCYELIALYKQRKLHRKALDLLKDLSQRGQSGQDLVNVLNSEENDAEDIENIDVIGERMNKITIKDTVHYLLSIGNEDIELLKEYSLWILEKDADLGLTIFTKLHPPLPTSTVLEFFKSHAPSLRASYLETLLSSIGETNASPALHDELIQLLLDRIMEEREVSEKEKEEENGKEIEEEEKDSSSVWKEEQLTPSRTKLLSLLQKSSSYNPFSVFHKLPPFSLIEERVILLERMNAHIPVLVLYARKLNSPHRCVSYCDKIFASSSLNPNTVVSVTPVPRFPRTYSEPTSKPPPEPISLYQSLLSIFLDPSSACKDLNKFMKALSPSPAPLSSKESYLLTKSKGLGRTRKMYSTTAKKMMVMQVEQSSEGLGLVQTRVAGLVKEGNEVKKKKEEMGEKECEENAWGLSMHAMTEDALNLVIKRWERIDAVKALTLIPQDCALTKLIPFLQPCIWGLSESNRNSSVIQNLTRSENLQTHHELLLYQKRVVKITNESTCAICHKRVGSSVFAVNPDQTIVHFVCYQEAKAGGGG